MVKYITYYFVLFLVLLSSCERRDLEDRPPIYAHIPITIDWTESLINEEDVDRVSIYFYPVDGGEPTIANSDDKYFKLVQLRAGKYSVLVFNEFYTDMRDVFDYQELSDYSKFNVSAYDVTSSFDPMLSFFLPTEGDVIKKKHQQLAVWSLNEFEVTQEMVTYTRTKSFQQTIEACRSRSKSKVSSSYTKSSYESDPASKSTTDALSVFDPVKPTPLTTINNLSVEIDNINNAQMIEFVLVGSADGSIFSSKHRFSNSENRRSIYIDSRKSPYETSFITMDPGSSIDGLVHHRIITFGGDPAISNMSYELQINIALNSGELVRETRDVTAQITTYEDIINIELTDENKLVLPEYSGDGFQVGDWGENNNVYL